jgi:hypothetical protein
MNLSAIGSSSGYQALWQYAALNTAGTNKPPDPLAELDANGDGALDIEETGFSEEMFNKLDADGDGLLTEADRPSPPEQAFGGEGGKSPADLLAALDSDGDGLLTLEESGFSETQFDELDTNKDGVVSQAEMEAAGPLGPPPNFRMEQATGSELFPNEYAMAAYKAQIEQGLDIFGQSSSFLGSYGTLNLTA